jgi:hypothetical protein
LPGLKQDEKSFSPTRGFPGALLYGRKIFRPQTFEAKYPFSLKNILRGGSRAKYPFSLKNILRGGSRAKNFSPVREIARVWLRYDLELFIFG